MKHIMKMNIRKFIGVALMAALTITASAKENISEKEQNEEKSCAYNKT